MQKSNIAVVRSSGNAKCPYEVRFWEANKLFRKRFKNELDAQRFADEKNAEAALPEELRFENNDRIIFSQIKDLCARKRVELSDMYKFVSDHIAEMSPIEPIPHSDALVHYERAIIALKPDMSPHTLRFYKSEISVFFKSNNLGNVSDISRLNITDALLRTPSPVHVKRAVNPFFDWCVERGYLTANPLKGQKLRLQASSRSIPHVLSVEQIKQLLKALPDMWRPAFALFAFAGLRPSEIIDPERAGVTTANIDLVNKRITVDVGKMRKHPRIIVNAPANLWAWLEPLKKLPKGTPIAPASYNSYINLMRKLPVSMPKDVLRHSFGTYSYFAFGESVTKDIMGHGAATNTLFKYYKGLATPADAERYFSIAPDPLK